MTIEPTATERAAKIKLLVLDIDGVLTPGTVIYDHAGQEIKIFSVHDGHGIKLVMRTGIEVVLLSGRGCAANQARARDIGIDELIENAKIKLPVLEDLVARHGVDWDQVAYMGDDLIDLPPLRAVGLALAPADAIDEVLDVAHWVSSKPGGRGAVREACELILKSTDGWSQVTARYF